MRRGRFFGWGLFMAGCLLHAVLAYLWVPALPFPQILLLMTVATGALGKTDTAQTLGFAWGLFLDVQGATLFGAQGWILATAGFLTARLSREIDAEKSGAQAIIGAGAAFFHAVVLVQVETFFRRSGAPHVPGAGAALVQVAMTALAAPLVFRAVQWWARVSPSSEDSHVFRS